METRKARSKAKGKRVEESNVEAARRNQGLQGQAQEPLHYRLTVFYYPSLDYAIKFRLKTCDWTFGKANINLIDFVNTLNILLAPKYCIELVPAEQNSKATAIT